ncbi:MAG: DNA polymerase III subunit delta' [Deltaproteobacteria bacterium HGW-Deltaproteobacteria-4]|nr:MAG: DNA polymerase III subunit delta' [Deltaproteobacteria bacterium HGW-Deltaproteobacteria-4]
MTYSGILGHERQKTILKRAQSSGRLAHAYLFEGPEGVGKRLVALALARSLFCATRNGCGECPACRKVDHQNHPDLHIVEADGNTIKIEQIRALQKELSFRPLEGERKICVIEAAEKMNTSSGNALLKTLEEPAGHALLILLTSRPDAVLPTIRSRCQRLPFSRLPTATIRRALTEADAGNEAHAHILATLSDGSFHKALGRDRDLYLERRKVILKAVTALSHGSYLPLFELAAELAEEKERLSEILDILRAFYRDLLLCQHGWPEEDLINRDLIEKVRRIAAQESPQTLLRKIEAINAAYFYLERNVNGQLVFEVLLMRLTATQSQH